MSSGALIFAHNNTGIDYTKLAIFAANRVKQYLGIPVSIVTDNVDWLNKNYPDHPFDKVIEIENQPFMHKLFYDGTLFSKKLEWKNMTRNRAYDLTPYDTTLVIDSDYIVSSDVLKIAFSRDDIFQIYTRTVDLAEWRDPNTFSRINAYSIPFYWATVFVFKKNEVTQAFFDLITYIKQNWLYFRVLYNIDSELYRNDFAFSIAIHIMNGKMEGDFATSLPGSMFFTKDTDILHSIDGSTAKFLLEKKDHLGEYIASKVTDLDVHVMNKMSLSRVIDGGYGV